jgi:pyruvate,water dikinase
MSEHRQGGARATTSIATAVRGLTPVTNPYHQQSGPNTTWSRVNAAELALGVQTPLSLPLWDGAGEMGFRIGYLMMGMIGRSGLEVPPSIDEQFTDFFYGQQAVNIDMFSKIPASMPGAEAVEEGVFASSQGATARLGSQRWTRARTRIRLPSPAVLLSRRLRRLRRMTDRFWSQATSAGAMPDAATATLALALEHFPGAVAEQVIAGTLAGMFFGRVQGLLAKVDGTDLGLKISGAYGQMSEIRLTRDLARIASSNGDLSDFLARHGFHGPAEGEMSSPSGREDPGPVERMLKKYRDPPGSAEPTAADRQPLLERQEAERIVLGALFGVARLRPRVALAWCRHYIPLRVEAKMAFTQIFEVARAAARAIGDDSTRQGPIGCRDDILFLMVGEILNAVPADMRAVIGDRRRLPTESQSIEMPLAWTGMPGPLHDQVTASGKGSSDSRVEMLTAVGASFGVAEGVARSFATRRIPTRCRRARSWCSRSPTPVGLRSFSLQAPWSSTSGAMSHRAIVARELGIPCVINSMTGTRAIQSGNRVRVDGWAGTVQSFERA